MHTCPYCQRIMRQFAFGNKTCWVCPHCGYEEAMENSEYYNFEYLYLSSIVFS
ncbi:MAG: hypothetical protein PHU95_06475 [Candidatus Thermoplasmatota archaeon]|nr:hypothetical protein [Candidatus Thermoplasmatota archaeon]MDD5779075.1 hypothetical protein [Candidatus Thermoplasmatota archaeon]